MERSKVDFLCVVRCGEKSLGITVGEIVDTSEFPYVLVEGNSEHLDLDLPHNENITIDVKVMCGVFSKTIASMSLNTSNTNEHTTTSYPFSIYTIDDKHCVRLFQPPQKGDEVPIKSLLWFRIAPTLPGLKVLKIIQPYLKMYKKYRSITKHLTVITAKMKQHQNKVTRLEEKFEVCKSLQDITLRNLEEYELTIEKRLLNVK